MPVGWMPEKMRMRSGYRKRPGALQEHFRGNLRVSGFADEPVLAERLGRLHPVLVVIGLSGPLLDDPVVGLAPPGVERLPGLEANDRDPLAVFRGVGLVRDESRHRGGD